MSEKVLAYLAAHNVMTLSTSGPDGPWASAVFYASDAFTFYFVSSPKSRHAANLARDARVAAAIHEDYKDWRAIQGVQLSGKAERLEGTARDAGLEVYRGKFPFLALEARLLDALGKAHCYRLVAEELHWIDNAMGFGARTQILQRSR